MESKEVANSESKYIKFRAGDYDVNVVFASIIINIRAYSEIAGKLFKAIYSNDNLLSAHKEYFSNCADVFWRIEECVTDKEKIELNDTGELQFTYIIKVNKNNQIASTLSFTLKQV
jgi:hypothetical protein